MFSVVIPTFNRRATICAAIDSALSCPTESVEVIVVDDGSDDDTVSLVEKKYRGMSVRVLRNESSKGPAGARNTGIKAACGDYIAFLDSDDAFLPNHLSDVVNVFLAHPNVDVVFGAARYESAGVEVDYMRPNFDKKLSSAPVDFVDNNVCVFSDGFFDHLLNYGCWFNLSTVVMRSNVAREYMNPTLRIAEDYEFWVRLSRKYRFSCLKNNQIRYELHDGNISFEDALTIENNARHMLKAYFVMLKYADLNRKNVSVIFQKISDVYFDWAYRAREAGRYLESFRLQTMSLRYGNVYKNLLSLIKIPLAMIIGASSKKTVIR